MSTQELFDCSIEEMGLNARTRGALTKAGVTTLDGLEKALRSDQELPGLGPKAVDDIDRALDALEADRHRSTAVAAILRAHEDLANLLMLTTDLAIGLSAGERRGLPKGKQLDGPHLRKAAAGKLRESLRNIQGALMVLAPELAEAGLTVGEEE